MNAFTNDPERGAAIRDCRARTSCLVAAVVALLGISGYMTQGRAQQPDYDEPGAQVLTRGPVHEAFAGMVVLDPEPGIVVSTAPPNPIEEMPPEERPEGDNVTWIPGYWAWDDERGDFLWISGTWRALPPGREWMAGYWSETTQGFQWISGYWADTRTRETTYLPPPPATLEEGPSIAAPSLDYAWVPGSWTWYRGRYAWRPGYWLQGRAEWVWIPASYLWTPRGYIFVAGYWDYSVEQRGVLFAPVHFERSVYARRGYSYSPRVVISLSVFNDHLFLRPRYHHYYFGDYYASSYATGGIYASFSFQSSRRGYDPFYSHQRWEHRRDRDWERRVAASHQHRRDNENARPPRTWAAQSRLRPDAADSRETRMPVATSIDQLRKGKDRPVRFQAVSTVERQNLARRSQEVQQSREERRKLETRKDDTKSRIQHAVAMPATVQPPRSPIVAKPVNQLGPGRNPPKPPKAPKPDTRIQPKPAPTARQTAVDRINPPPEPHKPMPKVNTPPQREAVVPPEKNIQPEAQPRVKESGAKARDNQKQKDKQSQKKAKGKPRPEESSPPEEAPAP